MTVTADLEARIRRLEDRAELQELVIRYFNGCDFPDWDLLRRTFADDAEFAGGVGRDDIILKLQQWKDEVATGPTLHWPDAMSFSFDDSEPDRATGIIGSHWELGVGDRSLWAAARYVDSYVRERGEWRIHRRTIELWHVVPWEEVAETMTSPTPVRWPGMPEAPGNLPAAAVATGRE
jgi:hypothetical protein